MRPSKKNKKNNNNNKIIIIIIRRLNLIYPSLHTFLVIMACWRGDEIVNYSASRAHFFDDAISYQHVPTSNRSKRLGEAPCGCLSWSLKSRNFQTKVSQDYLVPVSSAALSACIYDLFCSQNPILCYLQSRSSF